MLQFRDNQIGGSPRAMVVVKGLAKTEEWGQEEMRMIQINLVSHFVL